MMLQIVIDAKNKKLLFHSFKTKEQFSEMTPDEGQG
jgi:hypothetical protein